MANETLQRPAQIALVALAALGPPAAVLSLFDQLVAENLVLTVVGIILYEVFVLILTLAGSVLTDLNSRWSSRIAGYIDSRVQRRISGFTERYVRHAITANRFIDVGGLSTPGDYSFTLDEVFIKLKLRQGSVGTFSANPVAVATEAASTSGIWRWINMPLRGSSILAIVGPPGSGKTTLLRHIAYMVATQSKGEDRAARLGKYPVIVELKRFKATFLESPLPSLTQIIRLSNPEVFRDEPPRWLEEGLSRGHVVVMFDGVDEMPTSEARQAVSKWIAEEHAANTRTPIIVTSRPFGYRDNPIKGALVLEVQPFAFSDVDRFIERWYLATCLRRYGGDVEASDQAAKDGARDLMRRLNEKYSLRELSVNPLLLTMIANVHEHRRALPGSRAELYKEVCEVFLGKRHKYRGVDLAIPAGKKQVVLESLAYQMTVARDREIGTEDATKHLEEVLRRVDAGLSVGDFLRVVEESSGLIVEREWNILILAPYFPGVLDIVLRSRATGGLFRKCRSANAMRELQGSVVE